VKLACNIDWETSRKRRPVCDNLRVLLTFTRWHSLETRQEVQKLL